MEEPTFVLTNGRGARISLAREAKIEGGNNSMR